MLVMAVKVIFDLTEEKRNPNKISMELHTSVINATNATLKAWGNEFCCEVLMVGPWSMTLLSVE